MKPNFNSIGKAFLAIMAMGLSFSCTDQWDEHYSVDKSVVPDMSILEKLKSNPETSEFVKVLETTKMFNGKKMVEDVTYDELLDADQFITVWAPSNSALTADEWAKYTKKNKTREENYEVSQMFIRNHIARFGHPVGETTKEKVIMMSKKRYESAASAIEGVSYSSQKNLSCSNGVLHIINGTIDYKKSIYEYITTEKEYADNLGAFFKKYTVDEIDLDKSVSAGIDANGQVIYIDSVTTERSILMDKFGLINEEDSNYVVVLPTGAAWDAKFAEMAYRFDYQKAEGADSLQLFWAYSNLLTDAFVNMNLQKHPTDSIVTTLYNETKVKRTKKIFNTYYKPFEADGIFANDVAEVIECSNGKIYKTNTWSFSDAYTWDAPIIKEAESSEYRVLGELVRPATAIIRSSKISEEKVLVMKGDKAVTDQWDATFGIGNTLAGWYNVYAVILPNDITGELTTAKPNQFNAYIEYFNENGRIETYQEKDPKRPTRVYKYNNDIAKIDTVLLNFSGPIFFPACNYEQEKASINVTFKINMTASETKTYSNTMYLDCIILEPAEAPEEEESGDGEE